MNIRLSVVLLGFCLAGAATAALPQDLPQTYLASPKTLAEVRAAVRSGAPAYTDALAQLRKDAAKALKAGPFSVTVKTQVPPSGDTHDYMSLARYYWPDPSKPNGLPYIQRDGETNPEIDTIPDKNQMNGMETAVSTLALAYYLTGEEPFAARATVLLRAWFLDPATRMNPNLDFGQAVKGKDTGRPTGLIDTRALADVVDAVGLLRGSPSWTAADQRGVETWYRAFLQWLQTSRNGKGEAAATNNHGVWYDVQMVSMALFTGQTDVATRVLMAARTARIAAQIVPDGAMPRELARTTSAGYTLFNLQAFAALAALGERAGIDLWQFETKDGRSIRKAIAFVLPYLRDGRAWPHKQIHAFNPAGYYPLLVAAGSHYPDLKLESLADVLGGPAARANRANLRFGRVDPATR